MKTNAIIRIVLFSLAIVVLTGILLTCFGIGTFAYLPGKLYTSVTETHTPLPGNEASNVGESTVPAEIDDTSYTTIQLDAANIRELEIQWVAGSITILPMANSDQITFSESKVEEKYQMSYRQAGDTLKIQFCENQRFNGIGINYDISKDLVITVPADWICNELDIDAAAASVDVTGLTITDVDFDGASGICTFTDCTIGEMDVDTASGDVRFTGNLERLSCSGMSANCQITALNYPTEIELESMSGDLDLTLPQDCGFSVKMDGMSSHFNSDCPTSSVNGRHVYGDGHCRIDVDAMSGDVIIRQHCIEHPDGHHNDSCK